MEFKLASSIRQDAGMLLGSAVPAGLGLVVGLFRHAWGIAALCVAVSLWLLGSLTIIARTTSTPVTRQDDVQLVGVLPECVDI